MSNKSADLLNDEALEPGQIRFYDNDVPNLPVGNYMISMNQYLHPNHSTIQETFTKKQFFSVTGPKYALAAEDILSFGPAANAQGIFHQYLPQVVLTRADLPWERNIFQDANKAEQTPWLALLLFVEGEMIDGQETLCVPKVVGWEANRNRVLTATISADQFYQDHSNEPEILWPDLQQEWYENTEDLLKTQSNIIDISPAAFNRFIAKPEELRYLAHAREIDPSAKDTSYLKLKGNGWYSVVIGKRLPNLPDAGSNLAGRLNIAHLVSLEGFGNYINGQETLPADKTRIRMISLASWSFTCLPEGGESFQELMRNLLVDKYGHSKSTSYHLSFPVSDDDNTISTENYTLETLNKGYIPLQYQTQQGEKTFAWYRGPFSPIAIENFVGDPRVDPKQVLQFSTASAANIYNKDYGLFDISYSTAWETGRLVALSDAYFASRLIAWQQAGHRLLDLLLLRQSQYQSLYGTPITGKALIDILPKDGLTRAFKQNLTRQFADTIAPKFYPHPTTSVMPRSKFTYKAPIASTQILDSLLADPAIKDHVTLTADEETDYLASWLADLYLLQGVPFANLVPNLDLLPEESVKFFYVDSNWLDCLIEGALSVGIQTSRDAYYQAINKNNLFNKTYHQVQQARIKLIRQYTRKKLANRTEALNKAAMTGLLLRSTAVLNWPGLEIKAYAKTKAGGNEPDLSTQITLLRMDRLANDVMLCLWNGIPAVVSIAQPQEGIQFGFDYAIGANTGDYYLYLRSLATADYGMTLEGNEYEMDALPYIDADRQLILLGEKGLIPAIQNKLGDQYEMNVRNFVTEMIKVPQQALFAIPQATENANDE